MIPQKIECFIFLPFLEKLISGFEKEGDDEYWEFLKTIYPVLYFEEGDVGVSYLNIASSFLYRLTFSYQLNWLKRTTFLPSILTTLEIRKRKV